MIWNAFLEVETGWNVSGLKLITPQWILQTLQSYWLLESYKLTTAALSDCFPFPTYTFFNSHIGLSRSGSILSGKYWVSVLSKTSQIIILHCKIICLVTVQYRQRRSLGPYWRLVYCILASSKVKEKVFLGANRLWINVEFRVYLRQCGLCDCAIRWDYSKELGFVNSN